MPRFPGFIGPSYADRASAVEVQECFNLYPEVVESESAASRMVLRRVPGKRLFATMVDGPIRGLFAQDGRCFVAAGAGVYELFSNGSATLRIVISLGDDPVGMASSGQAGNQLFVVAGGSGTLLNLATNVSTGVVAAGFPAAARGAAYLDGYFLTQAGVAVHASGLLDGATWSASSKAQRSVASDDLQTFLVDGHRVLWYIGSQSAEPWYDAGLSPYPFTATPQAFVDYGTAAPFSVARFDNSWFTIGQSRDGDRFAFLIGDGYVPRRISKNAVEQAWRGYATVSDARTYVYTDEGHSFAVVTFPTANATWVYDASTKDWHRRGKWDTAAGRFDAETCWCHCFAFGKHLLGSRLTGEIFELSHDVHTDDSDPIRWVRRAPHPASRRVFEVAGSDPVPTTLVDAELDAREWGDWVFDDRFQLLAETGVGLASGQGSAPLVGLRVSNDRGKTWGSEKFRSLGARGDYSHRVEWCRLGRALR